MRRTALSDSLRNTGILDYRNAVVYGRIESAHGKTRCLACINGNLLRILESDPSHRAGYTLEEIPLAEITNLNTSDFAPAPMILFEYKGVRFLLTRFGSVREFIRIVRWEAQRRPELEKGLYFPGAK